MDELIRRVDVARPLLEKYREVKRQAERARNLRNLGSCLAFRSDMETLRACIQIAVEAPAMGEAGGMIQEAAVRRPVLQDALVMYGQQAQIDMMLEEMAELSKALLKLRRAKKHEITEPLFLVKNVEEEIADVQIVLNQMKLLFPGWGIWMQAKLQRLEERIEKERWADADEGRTAGDRAAAAGGDGPAVRRPPGEGGHVKRRSREYERLAAMAAEAKRRGLSYGHQLAGTTEYERNQIVQKRRKT